MGTLLEEDSPTFLEEDSPSEGTVVDYADEFASYQAVSRFVQIKENVYMHLEPFEVMSYVTLTDHCGSHAFGHTLQDFQILCESSAWDLPEGLVVFNASIGKSLVFQSGVVASTLALWSPFIISGRGKVLGSLCIAKENGSLSRWWRFTAT